MYIKEILHTKQAELYYRKTKLTPYNIFSIYIRLSQHSPCYTHGHSRIFCEYKISTPRKGILNQFSITRFMKYLRTIRICHASILTDQIYFGGHSSNISIAKCYNSYTLRKDFLSTRYHMIESSIIGSDIILTIYGLLTIRNIDTLIKHKVIEFFNNYSHIYIINNANGFLIGINIRCLSSFVETVINILPSWYNPSIAESGLYKTDQTLHRLVSFHYLLSSEYFTNHVFLY
ncbi:hypothetical protein [Candidatus Vidania fulgoroideorum]